MLVNSVVYYNHTVFETIGPILKLFSLQLIGISRALKLVHKVLIYEVTFFQLEDDSTIRIQQLLLWTNIEGHQNLLLHTNGYREVFFLDESSTDKVVVYGQWNHSLKGS